MIRIQILSQNKTKLKLQIQKNCQKLKFEILQETSHAAHLPKLLDKMHKYEKDPTRTGGATERTLDAGRTDGQTDGRTDKVKPIYPPTTSLCRGYNNQVFMYIYAIPLKQLYKKPLKKSLQSNESCFNFMYLHFIMLILLYLSYIHVSIVHFWNRYFLINNFGIYDQSSWTLSVPCIQSTLDIGKSWQMTPRSVCSEDSSFLGQLMKFVPTFTRSAYLQLQQLRSEIWA